jgi:hypothetical protein
MGVYRFIRQKPIIIDPYDTFESIENYTEIVLGIGDIGHIMFLAPFWIRKTPDQSLYELIRQKFNADHFFIPDHQMVKRYGFNRIHITSVVKNSILNGILYL